MVSGSILNVKATAYSSSHSGGKHNKPATICSIPLIRSLPDLRGYRHLRIKFSEDVPSGFYNVYNDIISNLVHARIEVIVAGIVYKVPVTFDESYSTIDLTSIATVTDNFSAYAENPTASDIKIKLYLLLREDQTQRIEINIKKIWITET
jgi:hypothetical protein